MTMDRNSNSRCDRWRVRSASLALAGLLAMSAWPQAATAQPAQAPSTVVPEYRLSAGDVVRVTVYQNPDLSLEGRVSEAGILSYPLLGGVKIGGMTVGQAEKTIADGLRGGNFVKQPQVSLLVVQVRGNQASVLGQVNRPGRFPIETADLRLSELLANAGGIAPSGADIVTLLGTRDGKPFRVDVDLPAMFRQQARDSDLIVQNGDIVFVDRAPQAYIYGEVQRPGPLRVERDMTVMQALATGGGLTMRGTEKGMRIHRRDADGKVQVLQPALDDMVRPGDVVYVRESLF